MPSLRSLCKATRGPRNWVRGKRAKSWPAGHPGAMSTVDTALDVSLNPAHPQTHVLWPSSEPLFYRRGRPLPCLPTHSSGHLGVSSPPALLAVPCSTPQLPLLGPPSCPGVWLEKGSCRSGVITGHLNSASRDTAHASPTGCQPSTPCPVEPPA